MRIDLHEARVRPAFWIVGVLSLLAVSGYFLLYRIPTDKASALPTTVGALERATVENEYRRTGLQFFGGLLVLGGLALTWWRISVSDRQVKAIEDGQITSRFTEAIKLLAGDELYLRLGGIHALERIAKDSPKDEWTALEVLSGFLRNPPGPSSIGGVEGVQKIHVVIEAQKGDEEKKLALRPDLQAALDAISRWDHRNGTAGRRINLRSADLSHSNLTDAHLENVDLEGARLTSSNLFGAHFDSARLANADLSQCHVSGASFEEADLSMAILTGIKAWPAGLRLPIIFRETTAQARGGGHVSFKNASLIGTKVDGAVLPFAQMDGAVLIGTDFEGTTLVGASFSKAEFVLEVNLEGTDLDGADLQTATGLTRAGIDKALTTPHTKLPKDL